MSFAVKIVQYVERMPKSGATFVIGRQLLRSGTSVGANYRSACCARSRADFIAKMGMVEEECDETLYWMELLKRTGDAQNPASDELVREARQTLALVVASIRTARAHK